LIDCFQKFDDDLLVSNHEKMWRVGWQEYFKSNGTDSDFDGRPDHWGGKTSGYREGRDKANIGKFGNITVYEPCNSSSNIAFYKAV